MGRPHKEAALLLTALWGLCAPFTMDILHPRLFLGPTESQFGYKVLQHSVGKERWLLVSAPWDGAQGGHQGALYKCPMEEPNGTCVKSHSGDAALSSNNSNNSNNMHLGMELSHSGDGGVLVCAPLWSVPCGSALFSPGLCQQLDPNLRHRDNIAPTAQRCPTFLDIVILLDGSNSIYPWHEVQRFLQALLGRFHVGPQQSQVAVLQYGQRVVQEWPLGRYRSAAELVEAAQKIQRRESRETRTAAAISKACSQFFLPSAGGRRDASRLLLVVTDGESHDGEQLPEALRACDRNHVTRAGIAVLGHYLRRQRSPQRFLREVLSICSRPQFCFNVSDESALQRIAGVLGDRIFSIEGTHGDNESAFGLEMAQSGFSVHPLQDGLLFGAVGAFDWDGAVLERSSRGLSVPTRDQLHNQFLMGPENHAAYLGYSVSALRFPHGRQLLVGGAPRFRHRGAVLLFQMGPNGTVRVEQTLNGEQLGSYFGSVLCPLDLDADGVTDVLLVAAPNFLHKGWDSGRVHVYRVMEHSVPVLVPVSVLVPVPVPQDSRFGSALAALPDLNGDGWGDAAVGAPLEDRHRGALYIFHGHSGTVRPRHAQRISASDLGWSLRYFGRSIDGGNQEQPGGGGATVAVGAQGAAVILKSRPVVRVAAELWVVPSVINVMRTDCTRGNGAAVCVTGTVCVRIDGTWRGGDVVLHFSLSLDDGAVRSRAVFDSGSRQLRRRIELPRGEQRCEPAPFHVTDTTQFLQPLTLTLRLSLPDPLGPVLDEGSPSVIRKQIPFFKDCGEDDVCVTDLVLNATMRPMGDGAVPVLVRSGRRKLRVDAVLQNRHENAYNARVALSCSSNVHMASATTVGSAVRLECTALGEHQQLCSVGYPVLRPMAKVVFVLELEFSCSELLNRVELELEATSDSIEHNATLGDNTVRISAPVRYQPELFLTSESTLHRYEVHPLGTFPHGPGPEFSTTVKVHNSGCFPVRDVSLLVSLPSFGSGRVPVLSITAVRADNATCELRDPPNGSVAAVHPMDLHRVGRMDCSTARCRELYCTLGLQRGHGATVTVLRALHNEFFRAATFSSVSIVSTATLSAERNGMISLGGGQHRHESVLEVLRRRRVPVSLWILVGSAVGGLLLLAAISVCLWKFGFFTRTKPPEEEQH